MDIIPLHAWQKLFRMWLEDDTMINNTIIIGVLETNQYLFNIP